MILEISIMILVQDNDSAALTYDLFSSGKGSIGKKLLARFAPIMGKLGYFALRLTL
jgi:hypothetical protein